MNNLIDERDERTERRKKMKKYFDSKITLSTSPELERKHLMIPLSVSDRPERLRLLDEGSIITADDDIDFYIMKGTLRRFYNNLPDDFIGSINLGHLPFAQFPFFLGTWTKENIHIVDIGDGREAIEIDNTIDYESIFVQELLRMPYSIGISAEFAFSVDEEATEQEGIEMLNGVFIFAYGLVGEAGNVNSSGIQLKGDSMTLDELNKKLGIEPTEATEEKAVEATEEVAEEKAEEVAETVEEKVEETVEETAEEPAEEPAEVEPEANDETDKMLATMSEVIEKLNAKVDTLTEQIVSLTADKEAAEKELAVKQEKERKRIEKFKTLYPSLAEEEPVVEETKTVLKTDGIGEW